MDAVGLTIILEKYKLGVKIIFILLQLLFYFSKTLNIYTLYFCYYFNFLFLIVIIKKQIVNKNIFLFYYNNFNIKDFKLQFNIFYKYSSPLGIYLVISFFTEFFDRSYLQINSGTYQQGIYSFSFMISNMCFLVISPMFPLFTRELSILNSIENIDKMANLFKKFVPTLFSITTIICIYIFMQAKSIIILIGGTKYLTSIDTLRILILFPIFSVYSMLNGSVIYASGKTKILLNSTLLLTPIGLMISYYLLDNKHGLNLGATGLAIKLVFIEIISVIIILKENCSFLKLKIFYYINHIFLCLISIFMLGFISLFLTNYFTKNLNLFYNLFLFSFFYSIFIFFLFYYFPNIFGLNNIQKLNFINTLKSFYDKKNI
jgi:hypothetical protein